MKYFKFVFTPVLIWMNFEVCNSRGINGGIGCAACTLTTGIAMHMSEVNNDTILATAANICRSLPEVIVKPCLRTLDKLEPYLTSAEVHQLFTPDLICYGLHFCHVDEGAQYCNLFPKPKFIGFHEAVQKLRFEHAKIGGYRNVKSFDACTLPIVSELCTALYEWFENMQPAIDEDDDLFSTFNVARGTFWRGQDCNDSDADTHPGRTPLNSDAKFDSNCNGIFGLRPSDHVPWEKALCDGTEGRGVITVGDSIGAHFHMPESWFDASLFTLDVIKNISSQIFNEFDWPEMSFSTGFMNSTEPLIIKGRTDSIYLRLRERNLCNHRDYQNLARNGYSSFDHLNTSYKIARSMVDKPVLLLFELLGNDVCNNNPDTLNNMTTVEQFRSNILSFMMKLDKRLPPRSHVVLFGLVDGSRIYTDMAERYHPIGRLHHNVKYKDVYEWFLCMQIGPCNGWMNPDAEIRASTTKVCSLIDET
ncbi:acyloxyacyl hydrolase [Nilaparvata lugens]|uniref:acyloxyacyl hydrolase n=1 Tax=Nilaparvata lugens TaxID=108931 RepID=UPI00193CB428|nr:acyloxyacyl hydrolase [Nilaparvata lugens]